MNTVIQMDVYLDVLVILNTYMTWLTLGLTGIISRTHLKPRPRAAASFLGGLSSLIILIPDDVKLIAFTAFILKIFSCAAIVFAGFWDSTLRRRLMLIPAFLVSNMFVSAAIWLLQRLLKIPITVLDSGFIYLDISPLTLVMITAGVYLSAVLISKKFSRSFCPEGAYRVDFRIGCKAFSLDGFADTGNTARDLFSGLPVIICTGTVFEDGRGIRAVPYKTVSGEGVLYAILPEGLTLTNEKGEKKRVDALVAGLPGGEKRAVFNPKILY